LIVVKSVPTILPAGSQRDGLYHVNDGEIAMQSSQPNATIQRFFSGLAEQTFQTQLGVVDPPLVDYISTLLLRFVRTETVHRIRSVTGKPLLHIGELVEEATKRLGSARREIHQHIGDFTLFWVGVFPEALRQMGGDEVIYRDYCQQGKLSYQIASLIETEDDKGAPADVLERLSTRFELCAYGIQEVRREWQRYEDEGSNGPILLN
jgi:hypothetical protein